MFDHIDPRLFWAAFTLVWFVASWCALWLWTKLIDGGNPRRNRYTGDDHVASMHRLHKRNGFKSRQGIR